MTALERSIRRSTGYGDVRRDPKPKKRKKASAKSPSYLDKLWRAAVRKRWGGRCALLGQRTAYPHMCEGPLESHHFIPRTRMLLKHDPLNGVLLCTRAHSGARMTAIRKLIESVMGKQTVAYLARMEQVLFKDWLVDNGLSRDEFRRQQVRKLKALV